MINFTKIEPTPYPHKGTIAGLIVLLVILRTIPNYLSVFRLGEDELWWAIADPVIELSPLFSLVSVLLTRDYSILKLVIKLSLVASAVNILLRPFFVREAAWDYGLESLFYLFELLLLGMILWLLTRPPRETIVSAFKHSTLQILHWVTLMSKRKGLSFLLSIFAGLLITLLTHKTAEAVTQFNTTKKGSQGCWKYISPADNNIHTLCINDYRVDFSLYFTNEGNSSDPTTCRSKGAIVVWNIDAGFSESTHEGHCDNGRDINGGKSICQFTRSMNLRCVGVEDDKNIKLYKKSMTDKTNKRNYQ